MKVAVVTGGSSGIGQAAATRIAERGAGVIVTYNTNPEGAKETVAARQRGRACARRQRQ
jgi:NAD(P)-dependent dehydrogenase (short-subunit alcohol dehydrogenase family)